MIGVNIYSDETSERAGENKNETSANLTIEICIQGMCEMRI